jgi:hypothetical protein
MADCSPRLVYDANDPERTSRGLRIAKTPASFRFSMVVLMIAVYLQSRAPDGRVSSISGTLTLC